MKDYHKINYIKNYLFFADADFNVSYKQLYKAVLEKLKLSKFEEYQFFLKIFKFGEFKIQILHITILTRF